MASYFKELLYCLREIEKDLHAISSSMKAPKKDKFIPTDSSGTIYNPNEKHISKTH